MIKDTYFSAASNITFTIMQKLASARTRHRCDSITGSDRQIGVKLMIEKAYKQRKPAHRSHLFA